jgi:hypothetical protein
MQAPLAGTIVIISKQLGITENAAKTLLTAVGRDPNIPDESWQKLSSKPPKT